MRDDHSGYEDTEWWRTHFSGLMLDLWQSLLPSERAAGDADFLQTACQLQAGSRILDVPCGEGRVACELANRGFRVVGVDISADLLRVARQRAEQRNQLVEWHEGDMRDLPWEQTFDAAFCWGDSFGYMDDAGNEQFLAAVRRALKPGGRWAMEMGMVAEVLFPRYREELTREVNGLGVALRRSYNAKQGRLTVDYTLTRAGTEEKRSASYRIYNCSDLCRMLEQAGFVIDRLYGGPQSPFQIGSERLCIVATNGTGN